MPIKRLFLKTNVFHPPILIQILNSEITKSKLLRKLIV